MFWEPHPSEAALTALYDRYFKVVPATTPALLDAIYMLRYQVYCVENAFEDPAEHLDEREIDRYDRHSVHAALVYVPDGRVVGCVRLILPQPDGALTELPIRGVLGAEGNRRLDRCDAARTAEISRFAVSKLFRRRASDGLYPDVNFQIQAADARRLVPHLSLGLLRAVGRLASLHGITTLTAAMAPPLLRLMERYGLMFEPIGPLVEYHGARQPCVADCEQLLAGMATRCLEYYEVVDAEYPPVPPGAPRPLNY